MSHLIYYISSFFNLYLINLLKYAKKKQTMSSRRKNNSWLELKIFIISIVVVTTNNKFGLLTLCVNSLEKCQVKLKKSFSLPQNRTHCLLRESATYSSITFNLLLYFS